MQDIEIFKQIPGYKAILQAVIKNQIQNLVQQLATETGEESVLITASIEEGTLSQLGSEYGKVFLEGHEEIKSQFLGFCLKRKQIQKQTKEFQDSQPRKSWTSRRSKMLPTNNSARSHPYPVSMTKVNPRSTKNNIIPQGAVVTSHSVNNIPPNLKHSVKNTYPKPTHSSNHSTNSVTNTCISQTKLAESIPLSFSPPTSLHSGFTSSTLKIKGVHNENVPLNTVILKAESNIEVINDMETFGSVEQEDNQSDVIAAVSGEKFKRGSDSSEPLSDEIIAGQVDEPVEADEQKIDQKVKGQGKNQMKESGGNTEGDLSMVKVENVTSLSGRLPGNKPKLKLFNQNKKIAGEKSVKERKAELENYLNLDNVDRPYPCNMCPKRFKERHHLVYHIRTHSGHRPYVCNICNKSFTQSSSLNTHRKLHMKDMSCSYCGQVFRKLSLLQNHACKVLADDGKFETLDMNVDV